MEGISNILESLDDLDRALMAGIDLVKGGGFSLGKIGKLIQLVNDIADLVKELDKCLPEIKDIDAAESGALMAKCYEIVQKAVDRISK